MTLAVVLSILMGANEDEDKGGTHVIVTSDESAVFPLPLPLPLPIPPPTSYPNKLDHSLN